MLGFESVGIVAILFPIMVLSLLIILIIALRYMSHRERLAMVEKGLVPKPQVNSSPKSQLRTALVTTFVGLAITLGLFTIGVGPFLLAGLIPMLIGIANLIWYYATHNEQTQSDPTKTAD